jgi:MarR family transcriptional regulator, 2-MHQ and catechol-resistance regulon repressor
MFPVRDLAMSTRLQHELKKKQPFELPSQAAALGLMRTNDQLQIRFARLFRQYGLTPSQYNVLRILRGEGAPLPILEIAERTVTVVPGITGLIDRLEAAGLVERERSAEDRRVVFVTLTDKATKTLAKMDRPLIELHERLMKHMSSAEINDLVRLLDKVRVGLPPTEP